MGNNGPQRCEFGRMSLRECVADHRVILGYQGRWESVSS